MTKPSNSPIYIFVDEAGDMDFTPKGSRHYMFNFLVKSRPFQLHETIANYRYDLLEKNLSSGHTGRRLDIEAFHAHNDNKHIKESLFEIISNFDENKVKVYSYILEKPKVDPDKRKQKDTFYISNLRFAIECLFDQISLNQNIVIVTDRLPVAQNKSKQIKALKKGIKEYFSRHALNGRYEIYHHCSASSANLQIIDYIGWAIYRKYEHGDERYYGKIKRYILDEEIMTKDRIRNHY